MHMHGVLLAVLTVLGQAPPSPEQGATFDAGGTTIWYEVRGDDFNVAPSVAWGIHRAIPGSELAVFEKSGHLPFCEESEAFASRVEAF
ncbi:MAG TPA: hypothetical protein VKA01_09065, partial [Vicinamibacteria bacterium]|nr:hypothetical protein [Vicinamibacteria bacterium]